MLNPINPIKQKTKIHAEQMGLTDLANRSITGRDVMRVWHETEIYIRANFVSKEKIKQEAESLFYPCKACKHSSCQMIRKLLKSLGLDL